MAGIKVLPPMVRSLIAAGEVIEHPAGVVKELVENALDAAARRIEIDLAAGGVKRIRVSDDGAGIAPNDMELATEHFATSKLATADEIYGIRTYGFRGEALAAIAAAGMLTVLSRRRELLEGSELRVLENGRKRLRPAACAPGTAVTVDNLFHSLPARRKFLKSPRAETARAAEVVTRLALPQPQVAFILRSDGRVLLDLPAQSHIERLRALLGGEFAASGIEFNAEYAGVLRAEGFLGLPSYHRPNRTGIYVSVGRRPVWDATLLQAVVLGYQGLLPDKRYPAAVIDIAFAPLQVDVNVHPQKREVRLSRPDTVRNFMRQEIHAAITGRRRRDEPAPADENAAASAHSPPPIETATKCEGGQQAAVTHVEKPALPASAGRQPPAPLAARPQAERFDLWHGAMRLELPAVPSPRHAPDGRGEKGEDSQQTTAAHAGQAAGGAPEPAPTAAPEQPAALPIRYVGQLSKGYLLVEAAGILRIVDPHALHERMIYEALQRTESPRVARSLLFPAIISLSQRELAHKDDLIEVLSELGFDAREMGRAEIGINAAPEPAAGLSIEPLVREVLAEMQEHGRAGADYQALLRARFLEVIACQAAVKLGKQFSEAEALDFIRRASEEGGVQTCPHGRPTSVDITISDVERKMSRH